MCKKTNNNNTSITEVKESFAKGLNFYKLFWIFYIGCFTGVVVETVWCILKNGYFESRTALIFSPLNPVYGFGAILISIIFVRMTNKKNIYIFLGCMFVGGLFEYLCSLFQEIFFGSVSWSYHADSLGIFERTSLIYCIFWGFLGIVWVRVVYPILSKLIENIPNKIGKILTYVLLITIIIDCVFSSKAVLRQEQRKHGIEANNILEKYYDKNYGDDVLKKIYPHMTFVK